MRAPVATIVLLGALAFGAACGGKSEPNVAPQPKGKQAHDAELVTGRQVFVANCQRCHGPRGQGLAGPRLAGVVTSSFPNMQNEINVVTNGYGAMPAWNGKLTRRGDPRGRSLHARGAVTRGSASGPARWSVTSTSSIWVTSALISSCHFPLNGIVSAFDV